MASHLVVAVMIVLMIGSCRSSRDATAITNVSAYNISCSQRSSCDFFRDVLLVIKLNPVRLLWLDLLLDFYGTGFQNIVFFSSLRKGDASVGSHLTIGARDVRVHLLEDNYGFCDHETVSWSMKTWPHFSGYLFLSDDVLLQFWKLTAFDKSIVWKQKASFNKKLEARETAALQEIFVSVPEVRNRIRLEAPPFASTSGVYFVPSSTRAVFRQISAILMRHRTYNEWGTPILLQLSVPEKSGFQLLRGKLVWGAKRLLARRTFLHSQLEWYHPVRASGEAFARFTHLVRGSGQLRHTTSLSSEELFTSGCFNCATHTPQLIPLKGLYHSCWREKNFLPCSMELTKDGGIGLPAAAANIDPAEQKKFFVGSLNRFAAMHYPKAKHGLVGGVVHVPIERSHVPNTNELRHEGFWGKNITEYIFGTYYPALNQSSTSRRKREE